LVCLEVTIFIATKHQNATCRSSHIDA